MLADKQCHSLKAFLTNILERHFCDTLSFALRLICTLGLDLHARDCSPRCTKALQGYQRRVGYYPKPFETGISKGSELQKPDTTSPVIVHSALYNVRFSHRSREGSHEVSLRKRLSPKSQMARKKMLTAGWQCPYMENIACVIHLHPTSAARQASIEPSVA